MACVCPVAVLFASAFAVDVAIAATVWAACAKAVDVAFELNATEEAIALAVRVASGVAVPVAVGIDDAVAVGVGAEPEATVMAKIWIIGLTGWESPLPGSTISLIGVVDCKATTYE